MPDRRFPFANPVFSKTDVNSGPQALPWGSFLSCHYYSCFNRYLSLKFTEAQAASFFCYCFIFCGVELALAEETTVTMGSGADPDTCTDKR